MADPRSSTVLGSTIGRHRIVKLIGGGAVGRVFACLRMEDDRPVAIKVLRTKHAGIGAELMRERAKLERVESPHAVKVHDVSVYNNVPYVVMDLVEGHSLAALLDKGPLRSVEALEVGRALSLGLQAAWAQGVAHGDVRPENILLPDGDVRRAQLVDFLLAPPLDAPGVRGSPAYLAPELLVGTPPDPLSDLYAVGCTLYRCLAGQTPFAGLPAAVLRAQMEKPSPTLAAMVPGPQALVDLVDRMREKDRSKRVKTYAEVLDGIERALRGVSLAEPRVALGHASPSAEAGHDDDFEIEAEAFDDGGTTDEIHTSPAHDAYSSDEHAASVSPTPVRDDDVGVYRSTVRPLTHDDRGDEHTRVDSRIASLPVNAADIGLVLEPVARTATPPPRKS
ncbi:MAG TPA: serine/threonine-protein kinase [Myxococcota bacterium]|jgi:serine/threonine protein kinase